jgi:hypothetical protein
MSFGAAVKSCWILLVCTDKGTYELSGDVIL